MNEKPLPVGGPWEKGRLGTSQSEPSLYPPWYRMGVGKGWAQRVRVLFAPSRAFRCLTTVNYF